MRSPITLNWRDRSNQDHSLIFETEGGDRRFELQKRHHSGHPSSPVVGLVSWLVGVVTALPERAHDTYIGDSDDGLAYQWWPGLQKLVISSQFTQIGLPVAVLREFMDKWSATSFPAR